MSSILVVGPGAIGSYLACLLQAAGHEVSLVGRRPEPPIHPYHIEDRELTRPPILPTMPSASFEALFLCVKLVDLGATVQQVEQSGVQARSIGIVHNGRHCHPVQ